ncbi:hypothetical protein PHMEG_00041822, partial [Phytophthora megakarya]
VRDTGCKARLNLRVTAGASGKWYLRANASDIHSLKTNKHIWANYAEIRVVTDPHLTKDKCAAVSSLPLKTNG